MLVASIIAAAVSGFMLAKQSNHMEEELDDIEE